MGQLQAQIELTPAEPVLIDLSGSADPGAMLHNRLPLCPKGCGIVLLIPAASVRTRRFALSMELSRPVSNADLEELTEAASDLPAEDKGLAVLYRQPASFILDHKVFALPPIGQSGGKLTTEFLDLSIPLTLAAELDELVKAAGHELADIITPHEALAYMVEEEGEALHIHLNPEDMVVTATSEAGLAGAGSMAAGCRHLQTDLILAGLAEDAEAGRRVSDCLVDPQTADRDCLDVLDARLEEMAGFAHHVRSASHGSTDWPVYLSGLGLAARHAAEIFGRVLGSEIRLEGRDEAAPLKSGAAEARRAPRRLSLPPDHGGVPGNRVLRWLRRHV